MVQGPTPSRGPVFLATCVLACLVCAVFFAVVGFEFIESDVTDQVVNNPNIRGLSGENLKHILTSRCVTSYYPVRTLTYAVDYQIWGLEPIGFKLTNGLIHLANVLLVFWLTLRLPRGWATAEGSTRAWWNTCVAAFSAGIFAIHPVVVEPVAWVAGREELLMTLGALGCIHFHLTARRPNQDAEETRRALACYFAAAVCCAMACLSNAVGAVIPVLIVAWDMLTLTGPRLRPILFGTASLWAIGLLTFLLKGPGSDAILAREVGAFSAQRLMLVMNVYWLNLKTLAWPTDLSLSYELLRPESFLNGEVILGGIAVCLTGIVLWKLRRAKLVLFGVLWFGLALGPTSQIMPHHIHRADRFLYLPFVGLALALAAGLRPLENVLKRRTTAVAVVAIGVWSVLGILSWAQVQSWRSSVSLWEKCVLAEPDNPVAHRALADGLAKRGQFDRAIPHYETALRLEPVYIDALGNFAYYLVTSDNDALRDDARAVKLAERGCNLTKWRDRDLRRTLAMAYTNCAITRQRDLQFRPAIQFYHKAIEADADYDMALFNLAFLLATCADAQLRNADEAVRLAERACQMVEHPNPVRLSILAAAYAEAARFEQAVATVENAIQRSQANGNRRYTEELRRQLKLYQQHSTYSQAANKGP